MLLKLVQPLMFVPKVFGFIVSLHVFNYVNHHFQSIATPIQFTRAGQKVDLFFMDCEGLGGF